MQKFFRWCKKLSICSWKNSENSDKGAFKKSITKYSILGNKIFLKEQEAKASQIFWD